MVMNASKCQPEKPAGDNITLFPVVAGANRLRAKQAALDNEMSQLQAASSRRRFGRNETIFSEGDPAGFVYKVLDGSVRLCKHTIDGRRQVLDFMMPGDLFGFVDREYGFTAEAVTDVILAAYPRSQIDRLSATMPSVHRYVLDLVSENLLALQHHIVVLGCQGAKERVASFLLRQAERAQPAPGQPLDLPMGRQDMADHLGLTIETVCRAISELRRERVITVPNAHQVVMNNMRLLRAVTGGADAA